MKYTAHEPDLVMSTSLLLYNVYSIMLRKTQEASAFPVTKVNHFKNK
jgi:hypothetical protein